MVVRHIVHRQVVVRRFAQVVRDNVRLIRVLPAVIRIRVALMGALQQILVADVKVVKEIRVPVQHVRQL